MSFPPHRKAWVARGLSAVCLTLVCTASVAQVDGRADTQVDAQVDGRADTQVDAQVDGRADTQVDAQVDGRADTKVDTQADDRTDNRADTPDKQGGDLPPDRAGKPSEEARKTVRPRASRAGQSRLDERVIVHTSSAEVRKLVNFLAPPGWRVHFDVETPKINRSLVFHAETTRRHALDQLCSSLGLKGIFYPRKRLVLIAEGRTP